MVATATRTILESLDRLPNRDDRTKVAVICFDTALHFFSITASISLIYHGWHFIDFSYTTLDL